MQLFYQPFLDICFNQFHKNKLKNKRNKRFFHQTWLVLALLLGFLPSVQATTCKTVEENTGLSKTECDFLVQFYHRTGGLGWYKQNGWLKDNEPCNWYGITCDESGGHVTAIDLNWNNLSGMILDIRELPNLKSIDFNNNYQLCKNPEADYYEWQNEIDQFPDCHLVAAFDVSDEDEQGSVFPNQPFVVTLNAGASENFQGKIKSYKWHSAPDEQAWTTEQKITQITYTKPDNYIISLVVSDEEDEYGNESTNNAQRVITVREGKYQLTVQKNGNGRGTVSGAGINCGDACRKHYSDNETVHLYAHPETNSDFKGWFGGGCSGTSQPCTITMDQKKEVTATFDLAQHTLHIQAGSGNEGSVTSNPAGINCPSNCEKQYVHGTPVTLTANPNQDKGYIFAGWSGANCSGKDSCVITMDQAQNVKAIFVLDERLLELQIIGNGHVTSRPSGINCSSDCKQPYEYGKEVTLTAHPIGDYIFEGWTGDCLGKAECNITMDQARNVKATFKFAQRRLGVQAKEGGYVTSIPPGIHCLSDCEELYEHGKPVTLIAHPNNNYIFSGWSGPCSGIDECRITMDKAQNVIASFKFAQHPLTIQIKDGVGGAVINSQLGINCPPKCNEMYEYGKRITLTPHPKENYRFGAWGDNCQVTANHECLITMDKAQNVTATFIPPDTLMVKEEGCMVTSVNDDRISCGTRCEAQYPVGEYVTLTATPTNEHYEFASWDVSSCSDSGNICTVEIGQSNTVKATCVLKKYDMTVNVAGTGSGSISLTGGGNDFQCINTNTCSKEYPAEITVFLTAQPDENSIFDGWTGINCNSPDNCPIEMNKDKTITATFKPMPACSYELIHITRNKHFESIGGEGNVIVNVIKSLPSQQCSWEVTQSCDWVNTRIEGNSVYYSINENPNSSSRFCGLAVSDKSFTVIQNGNQAPKASITKVGLQETDESLMMTLSGENSFDPEGGEITYNWFLPEYREDTSSRVFMTFPKTEQTQIHSISLTVSDKFGESDADDYIISVPPRPEVTCAAKIATTDIPLKGKSPLTVALSAVEDEEITKYEWLTSDGQTMPGSLGDFTFEQRGTHTITLKTTCSSGKEDVTQQEVIVLMEPIAQFIAIPNTIQLSDSVKLDASDSFDYDGKIVEYQWETSDGQESSGKKAEFSFYEAGEYEISLVVVDNDNLSSTNLARQTIIVKEGEQTPPTAIIDADPLSSDEAPLTVHLDASRSIDPDGTIEQYQWFSSDGQEASGKQASLTFDEGGSYTISLKVTDNNFLTNKTTQEISVGNWAVLKFKTAKKNYEVGDLIKIDLIENLKVKSSFHRVDLWIAIRAPKLEGEPEGQLFFVTPFIRGKEGEFLSPTPQPYRKSLQNVANLTYSFLPQFTVVPEMIGKYTLYAVYVKEGITDLNDKFFSSFASNLEILEVCLVSSCQ